MAGSHTVEEGSICRCSFGSCPSRIKIPARKSQDAAHRVCVADHIPMVNIMPFGMCSSPANPVAGKAEGAEPKKRTAAPCMPCPAAAWSPVDPENRVDGQPSLTPESTLPCRYGGVISIAPSSKT